MLTTSISTLRTCDALIGVVTNALAGPRAVSAGHLTDRPFPNDWLAVQLLKYYAGVHLTKGSDLRNRNILFRKQARFLKFVLRARAVFVTLIVNGIQQPGQEVTYTIRRKHKAAVSNNLAKAGNAAHSVPVYTEESVQQEIAQSSSVLVRLCCTLVVWLYLRAGVSRETSNIILLSLKLIIITTFTIVTVPLHDAAAINLTINPPDIPIDIRTALKLHYIEPKIIRTMCCPKCFWVYGNDAPENCTWRESPQSRPCGESLWTTRQTGDETKRVPRRLYSTRSLDDWLQFFLGRKVIEDVLIASYEKFQHHHHAPSDEISDVHESRAWQSLHGVLSNLYNLIFGIYIDWFNPLTNRVAGKQVSYGAIVLYCLNPPPAPTVLHYAPPDGCRVSMFYHSMGTLIRLLVAPLLADIEGVHKVAGFKSHGAKLFCTFCDLESIRMEELDPSTWNNRTGAQ
ncbi:hypothetical protein PENSPDRAFT_672650, partial [Peniophora sp. CONT]